MLEVYHGADEREECFRFLDELQEGSKINMFGAGQSLRQEFGFTRVDARAVLKDWMETYAERHRK